MKFAELFTSFTLEFTGCGCFVLVFVCVWRTGRFLPFAFFILLVWFFLHLGECPWSLVLSVVAFHCCPSVRFCHSWFWCVFFTFCLYIHFVCQIYLNLHVQLLILVCFSYLKDVCQSFVLFHLCVPICLNLNLRGFSFAA